MSATNLAVAAQSSHLRQQMAGHSSAASSSITDGVVPSPVGRQNEGNARVLGGFPGPPLPDVGQPVVPESMSPSSLLHLLLAHIAAALALSYMLPFTKQGDQGAILLALAVIGAAALPLLYPRALLAMAAPLSLSFARHSSELHYKLNFNSELHIVPACRELAFD